MGSDDSNANRKTFLELKGICVPLLAQSRIDSKSIPQILFLLSDLSECLKRLDKDDQELSPALVSYTFFPLSTLLTRNESASIPDQVLEHIFAVLEILFRWWWWTCEDGVWEQVLMIAGAVVGGLVGKGKSRERADETKEAAARLLLRLLKSPASSKEHTPERIEEAKSRSAHLQAHAQTSKLVPVLGQTLNALLVTATSQHLPLQLTSLDAIEVIVASYVPDHVVPSILPGVASTMTRIALGKTHSAPKSKGWANGTVVAAALRALENIITRAIGDDACTSAGIVKEVRELEDLTELVSGEAAARIENTANGSAYETRRTPSWLRASASQLLIAFNTLAPLVAHPSADAQLALTSFASTVLSRAHLTLPDAQPLLLSFLLSLSTSHFPRVASSARSSLADLLVATNPGAHARLQTLTQHTAANFAALPRVLPAHDDAKIQHVAKQITAAARLPVARPGVAHLLGPVGHVEKWGTRLLSVLEFTDPSASVVPVSASISGLLEPDVDAGDEHVVFPEARLRHVNTRDTQQMLESMLRALGRSGGSACLFAIEWFVRAGLAQALGEPSAVGAMWCACRLLEGVAGVSLDEGDEGMGGEKDQSMYLEGAERRKAEKFARWVTKAVSELWEQEEEEEFDDRPSKQVDGDTGDDEDRLAIEYVKGVVPLTTRFDLTTLSLPSGSAKPLKARRQPGLHKSFALQLVAVSANVLRSHFSTLLIPSLYPILHSLISSTEDAFLASTASAALTHIAHSIGFASTRNLLLAHFDYALDGAARRLSRRLLDPAAARVLALLVRLTGKDAVERAGDVVEMCFDRLDDFHGYSVVVDGLLEALQEVVKVVSEDADLEDERANRVETLAREEPPVPDAQKFSDFVHWLEHRKDPSPAGKVEDAHDNGIHPFSRTDTEKGKSKDTTTSSGQRNPASETASPPPTPSQALTAQIVSRSISLLTHGSPSIRARILTLLTLSVPTLPADALLPAVHRAWPFVLNRLSDTQTSVVASAAGLVAALAEAHGMFMAPRVWEGAWPRFRALLAELDKADKQSALARRATSGRSHAFGASVGTSSAYTHAHRLYRSMLLTIMAALRGRVQIQDRTAWDVLLSFRRFLHSGAHPELQALARSLYIAFAENNADTVWLVLTSTAGMEAVPHLPHLREDKWDIQMNVEDILEEMDRIQ